MRNVFTRTIRSFSKKDTYISLLFQLLSISFVVIFWFYLDRVGAIDLHYRRVLVYFLGVAVFQYLFFYSFADDLSEILDNELEEAELLPGGIFRFALFKSFLPKFLKGTFLGILLILISLFINVLKVEQLQVIITAFLLGNFYYIFFSISMVIIGKLTGLSEYVGFSLRFIGFAWNGSYIPYVFMIGSIGSIFTLTPFFPSGLFLQNIWTPDLDITPYLVIVAVVSFVWMLVSIISLRSYLKIQKL